MVRPLGKTIWKFLIKLNILLLFDSAVMILGVYSQELNTSVYTKACTQIFMAALFIIAKTWS